MLLEFGHVTAGSDSLFGDRAQPVVTGRVRQRGFDLPIGPGTGEPPLAPLPIDPALASAAADLSWAWVRSGYPVHLGIEWTVEAASPRIPFPPTKHPDLESFRPDPTSDPALQWARPEVVAEGSDGVGTYRWDLKIRPETPARHRVIPWTPDRYYTPDLRTASIPAPAPELHVLPAKADLERALRDAAKAARKMETSRRDAVIETALRAGSLAESPAGSILGELLRRPDPRTIGLMVGGGDVDHRWRGADPPEGYQKHLLEFEQDVILRVDLLAGLAGGSVVLSNRSEPPFDATTLVVRYAAGTGARFAPFGDPLAKGTASLSLGLAWALFAPGESLPSIHSKPASMGIRIPAFDSSQAMKRVMPPSDGQDWIDETLMAKAPPGMVHDNLPEWEGTRDLRDLLAELVIERQLPRLESELGLVEAVDSFGAAALAAR
jgi:hypothetical protein